MKKIYNMNMGKEQKKIEEKFEFAQKEAKVKDKVNDILFSVLEDDDKFVD